jgi:hypothetical protein
MHESQKLITQAISGEKPNRTPIFDLLLHDGIIAHFGGKELDGSDDLSTVYRAIGNCLDGTRVIATPGVVGATWLDDTGSVHVADRWTQWVQEHAITDVDGWVEWIGGYIERMESAQTHSEEDRKKALAEQLALNDKLGGTVYIHATPSTDINAALFGYCGLENFSYLWADYPDLVLRWLAAIRKKYRIALETSAHKESSPMAMIYSDIAYKQRLMFGKAMFREIGFFDNVAEICDLCHQRGLTVIFHSDGYVMDVLPDLIAAGIDGLNPIEKAAGMDIYELRRLYPNLILVGGLDVTHLLPFGTASQVRAETRRMIDETGAEGRLLIGSSTELEDNVPTENYLAFHDEVMKDA